MLQSRRTFLACTTAGITILPFAARAAAHGGDVFTGASGDYTVHPIEHASFVMETPVGVIYADPVGDPSLYADMPPADIILVTHEHGDHFNAETLTALTAENTQIITNPAVYDMLPDALKTRASALANGDSAALAGMEVAAIPAYNLTEDRKNFHPQGRDNGYVLSFDGFRVYISGDTEDIPEMRALENVDLAFVCMNLPFTMDINAAASAVSEFKPAYVYPYHYRGREGGTQDPEAFAALVGDASSVQFGGWYS
jgi:L-ascorbate metabolism protein UlaG (beta-lactamase superfamily)